VQDTNECIHTPKHMPPERSNVRVCVCDKSSNKQVHTGKRPHQAIRTTLTKHVIFKGKYF